jgi:RNA polymerase sigma-70 factor (ECF subfamily)
VTVDSGAAQTAPSTRTEHEQRVTTKPGAARIDDAALVRAAQAGDQAAFEELVRLYDHAVLRLALNLTRSEEDARDAYQEAFLKVYKSLPNFRFECSFYTWIYRIVTNICLDQLRKKAVRKEEKPVLQNADGEASQDDFFAQVADDHPGGDPERDLIRRELGYKIQTALKRLTPRERLVFELKHYQGLKLRTIGEMLETSEQTAKNCLFRATQKLRESLAQV